MEKKAEYTNKVADRKAGSVNSTLPEPVRKFIHIGKNSKKQIRKSTVYWKTNR